MVLEIGWRRLQVLLILFAAVIARGMGDLITTLNSTTLAAPSLGVIFSFISSPTLTGLLISVELVTLVYLGLWVAPQLTGVKEGLSPLAIVSTATIAIGYVLTVQAAKFSSALLDTFAGLCFGIGLAAGLTYAIFSTEQTLGVRFLTVPVFIVYGEVCGYMLTVLLRYSPLLEIIILVSVLSRLFQPGQKSSKEIMELIDGRTAGLGTALTSQYGVIILGFSMIAISVGSLRLIGPMYIGDFTSLEAAAFNLRGLYATAFLVYAGLYWIRTVQRIPYWTVSVDAIDQTVPRRFGGYLLIPTGIYALTQRLITSCDIFNPGPPKIFALVCALLSGVGLLYIGWSLLSQRQPPSSRLLEMYQPNAIETEVTTVTVAFAVYFSSLVVAGGLLSLLEYSAFLIAGGIVYMGVKSQRTRTDWMTRGISGLAVIILGFGGMFLTNIVGSSPIGNNTPFPIVIALLVGRSLYFHAFDLIFWGLGYLLFLVIQRSTQFEIGRPHCQSSRE